MHLFILAIWYLFQVNDDQKYLFTKKGRRLEGLPSTRDAPEQHVKRTVYQGGYVWGQATALKPSLPEPINWGGTLGEKAAAKGWSTVVVRRVVAKDANV